MGAGKKWSKGKTRERLNNKALCDPEMYQRVLVDVPKGRVITPATLSDKYKISGSLARALLKDLYRRKLIDRVVSHGSLYIYTRTAATIKEAEEKAAAAAAAAAEKLAKEEAKKLRNLKKK